MIDPGSTDPYTLHWRNILENGRPAAPRGEATSELLNAQMTFPPGYTPGRKNMNLALGYMELLQFVHGSFKIENIAKVAPNANLKLFEKQSDYGPRTWREIDMALEAIQNDPETRRAVFVFPKYQESGTDELPCTLTGQFIQREGKLYSTFNMRSSDAAFGVAYDTVMFGGLTLLAARTLGYEPGLTTINFASAHIYDQTAHLTPRPLLATKFSFLPEVPTEWEQIREWARQQIAHAPWSTDHPLGMTVSYFRED